MSPTFASPLLSSCLSVCCALAVGCSSRADELDTGHATEGDDAGGPDDTGGADGSDPDAGPADGGPAEGGSGPADTGGADPGVDPEACETGGGVSASFEVDDHDWPEAAEFDIDLDVECTIVDMGGFDGTSITPALECDVDGMLRTVAITMADPGFTTTDGHSLLPAFDVGDAVRFRHRGVQNAGGLVDGGGPQASHYLLESFALHSVEGRLLAAGFRDWGMAADLHAPVAITEDDTFCGESQPFPDDPERPMLMTFTVDDASLSLVGGHAGFLDLSGGFHDDGLGIVAEVAQAGGCCHTDRQYEVLIVALNAGEG